MNSQQAAGARAAALLASCDSDTFVFLAPEQLAKGETRDTLRRAGPHLHLSAHHVSTIPDKERELVRAAREFAGPGIVYAATMPVAAAVEASEAETEREDEVERTRLTMMRRYAEHTGCRRSFLLTYFGQDYRGPCGNCDNDLGQAEGAPAEVPFAVGARVVSKRWGEGTVQRYDGDQVTVLFDEHGYRELFVPVVLERSLLRPA